LTARGTAGNPQFFDKSNLTGSDSYGVKLNLNASEPQFSLHLWDVAGASASSFDATGGFNGAAPGSSPFNDFPDITPSSAPGLTIMQGAFGTASQSTFASGTPTGAVFDTVTYTTSAPLFDQDRMDNGDPAGHAKYATTAAQTWNFNIGSASFGSTSAATACTYK
jgi:hypothetical protein